MSGASGVAEECDVQARTVGPAAFDAFIEDPLDRLPVWDSDALRHEHDVARGIAIDVRKNLVDLCEVLGGANNKLELLIGGRCDELVDGFKVEPAFFVACCPFARFVAWVVGGGGVGELGREAHEVARDPREGDGARGFDRDVESELSELVRERDELFEDHGLAAGEHGMADARCFGFCDERLDGAFGELGFPARIRGIAPGAAEIAPRESAEPRGDAGEFAFALNGGEGFRDGKKFGHE